MENMEGIMGISYEDEVGPEGRFHPSDYKSKG